MAARAISLIFALIMLTSTSQLRAQCSQYFNFSFSTPACAGDPVRFMVVDSNFLNDYSFKWGDGNTDNFTATTRNHTYSSSGSYIVTLYIMGSSPSCIDSIKDTIIVYSPPTANFSFSPDSACSGTNVNFSNTSTGNGLSYSWDFGDPSSGNKNYSNSANPTHRFDTFGTSLVSYTAKLVVTNSNGCKDSISKSIYVKERPKASIAGNIIYCGATVSNPNDTVTIYNTSTYGTSYSIDWGDTSSSSTFSSGQAMHIYTSLGVFDLKITATGSNGCSDTRTYEVINETTPSVSLTLPNSPIGCAPKSFIFHTSPTNVSRTTLFYWIFTDGDTVIWTYQDYLAHYDSMNLRASLPHLFDTTSCGKTVQVGTTTYQDAFGVEIIVLNACHTSLSNPAASNIAGPVRICQKPVADFDDTSNDTLYVYCITDSILFRNLTPLDCANSSTLTCNGSTFFQWDFGDSSSLLFKTDTSDVQHKFTQPGIYQVKLRAWNSCGTDSIIKPVVINEPPTANFSLSLSPTSGCGPITVDASDSSTGGDINYNWTIVPSSGRNFINNSDSSSQNPSFYFFDAGKYYIKLIVENNCGIDSLIDSIVFKVPPTVQIDSIANGCAPHIINPVATINAGGGTLSSITWSFPGGNPSSDTTLAPDTIIYSNPGNYTITLSVTNECGTTSDSATLIVFPSPSISVGPDDTLCLNDSIYSFTVFTPGGGKWYGTGVTDSINGKFDPAVSDTGTFNIIYFYTDSNGCSNQDTIQIVVNPLPIVNAGNNDTACISDAAFQIIGYSPAGGIWSGTGVSSSGIFNPSSAGAGIHKLMYHYSDSTGCSNLDSILMTVVPLPTINAGVNDSTCINNGIFTFSGFSPTGGSWSGNGITNPSGKFDPAIAGTGDHYAVYTYIDPVSGCTNIDSVIIHVFPMPDAWFSINDSDQCLSGNSFIFTDSSSISSGNLTNEWDFGDNTTSSTKNPIHVYTTDSTFTVKLITTSDKGCMDTAYRQVVVYPAPVANFATTAPCVGDSSYFSDSSSVKTGSIVSYRWFFGDGDSSHLQQPVHLYDTAGDYSGRLIVASNIGCRDTADKIVNVGHYPVADFSIPRKCLGDTSLFTDASTIGSSSSNQVVSWDWDFGDNTTSSLQNPAHLYTSTDTFQVQLVVASNFGCKDTIVKPAVVDPLPDAGFTVNDSSQCLSGNSFTFINNSTIASGQMSWLWDFGDNTTDTSENPTAHQYTSTGTYQVRLVATSGFGCKDTFTKNIYVNVTPSVSFSVNDSDQCLSGNSFTFTNNTTGGSSYQWYFGDGNSSTDSTPTHSYTYPDTFTIKLIVGTGAACTDSIQRHVYVRPMPTVDFTINDSAQCLQGNSFIFNNNSNISSGNLTWLWRFGDSTTDTPKNPSHYYGAYGNYSVKLIATSSFQCADSATKPVIVHPQPQVAFNINDSDQCFAGNNFSFTNTSSIASGNIAFKWYFGDGDSSANQHPGHIYSTPGPYKVRLIVTTDKGCIDSTHRTVYVFPMPVAWFTINDSDQCLSGNNFVFADSSFISSGNWTNEWDFGDTSTSSSKNPTHVFTTDSTFTVRLIITSDKGCEDTAYRQVVVHPTPMASFGATAPCVGDSSHFSDSSTVKTGSIVSYRWLFGDGDSSTLQQPVHFYDTAGDYSGRLIVTSNLGCRDTFDKSVYVGYYPVADFSVPRKCLGDSSLFTDASTIGSGSSNQVVNWNWSFGDNTSSSLQNPAHLYASTDTFQVQLVVASNFGCKDTIVKPAVVDPLPATTFTVNDTSQCLSGNSFTFTNTSTISSGHLTWLWDFDDNTTDTSRNPPAHHYTAAGTYQVRLIATSAFGCKDTFTKDINVNAMPSVSFSVNDSDQCLSGNSFTFTNNTTGGSNYTWYFGDGNSSMGTSPTHSYTYPDTFTVKLVVGTGASCADSIQRLVYVRPMPIAAFAVNDSAQCLRNNSFIFSDSSTISSGNLSYQWSFGDNNGSPNQNPTHSYAGYGVYQVKLKVNSTFGCSDSTYDSIKVAPQPQANFTFSNLCLGDTAYFSNTTFIDTGNLAYRWFFHYIAVDSSSLENPKYYYDSAGTYLIRLIAISVEGCIDSIQKNIDVYPIPIVDAGPDDTVCLNNGNYYLTGHSPLGGYWLGQGVDSNGLFKPALGGTGNHHLQYIYADTSTSCRDTAERIITVLPIPVVSAGTNDSICVSNGLLHLSGFTPAGGYWFGTGITHPDSTTFDPSISGPGNFNISYVYQDSITGCSDTASKVVIVHPEPQVSFTLDSIGCAKQPIRPANLTSGASSYLWSFGDNSTSQDTNPTHYYADSGFFNIRLIATNGFGCTDTAEKLIEIIDTPTTNFILMPDSGCSPLMVSFTNLTTGKTTYRKWDFGNGDTSAIFNPPPLTYLQSLENDTTYFIQLTSANICGSRIITDSVKVKPRPIANFGTDLNSGCSPQLIKFQNLTTGRPQSFLWIFGDGDSSQSKNPPPHVFTTDTLIRIYTVKLITYNPCGSDTFEKKIIIYPNTVTSFFNTDTTKGCAPFTITFTNHSTGATIYEWDLGDGNRTTDTNVTHTYSNPGTYKIKLAVNNGCSYDTSEIEIIVYPKPVVSFSFQPRPSCDGQPMEFLYTSSDSIAGNIWYFGNGDSSDSINPVYRYPQAGKYEVTLVSYTKTHKCIVTTRDSIEVIPNPIAMPVADTAGCQPLTVNFSNNSLNAKYYIWDFGDGNTSVNKTPTHIFINSGTFAVRLIAFNDSNCSDTATISVKIDPKPVSKFTMDKPSGCAGPVEVTFNSDQSTRDASFSWDFGNGKISPINNYNNPTTIYDTVGTYSIRLIVKSKENCLDTSYGQFTIYPQPIADYTAIPQKGCQPLEVFFNNQSKDAVNYQWYFGDGDSSTSEDTAHLYLQPGLYNTMLIARNGDCTDTVALANILVHPKPVANFDYVQVNNPKAHGQINFINTSSDADRYLWTFDNLATSTDQHPSYRFPGNYEFSVRLVAFTEFDCRDTIIKAVKPDNFYGLFVPNAFIPDGEPREVQLFLPKGVGLKEYRIDIYTTWGQWLWGSDLLDENGSPVEGWDGTYKGKPMPQDVYVWIVEAKFVNGNPWPGQPDRGMNKTENKPMGSCTLIR